ncbi:MAG: DegT/DnrJ/EryC1/StrS family aminotransferase [Thermoguttaceae bacterium]|jgi:perosamine synthetase
MLTRRPTSFSVPFFRPSIGEAEIAEVVACLRSGWLTSGPRTKQFEQAFADFVGARHAVAVSSCTAALHLAVDAMGLRPGQAVLIPTMTFAATAEVIRYQGATPILVDCDPVTLNMDLDDAEAKLDALFAGRGPLDPQLDVVGIIPVHVGGLMMELAAVEAFAERHGLWIVEDAAHALPAAYRRSPHEPWQRCGQGTAAATCFSFYANKTITTGEGGMVVTDDDRLAGRIRQMALHGLSQDAWDRYNGGGRWDYQIVEAGFKYNLTDTAAALGIHQLRRAETMRSQRESLAAQYRNALGKVEELALPLTLPNRIHSWHLFPVRLRLERLGIDRNRFVEKLRERGVGFSVHWRPLHLHPYYRETFGWCPEHCPVATAVWQQLVSLPLYPTMDDEEQDYVIEVVQSVCREFAGESVPSLARRKPR